MNATDAHLEVSGGERLVVIDGERFPCIDVDEDTSPDGSGGGTFYYIPLENGLVASFCNGPEEWGGRAELWLNWLSPPGWRQAHGNFLAAMIDDGVVVRQSPLSARHEFLYVESGAEIRAHIIAWSQMTVIDSAALREYRDVHPC